MLYVILPESVMHFLADECLGAHARVHTRMLTSTHARMLQYSL